MIPWGTERAAEIWIGAIPLILKSEKRDFWAFAKALQDSAGDDKAEIHEALVGVELDPAKTPP